MMNRELAYRLNNIKRYNPHPKVGEETVAAHSYFVAFFTSQLCTRYKVSDIIRLYSYEAAIYHDLPEVMTNDITHDVKEMIPKLDELLSPYEEQIVKEQSEVAYNVLFNPQCYEAQVAKMIVKMADIMSVLQFCENEKLLGNSFFDNMVQQTEMRLASATANLEMFLEQCKTKTEKTEEERHARKQ